MSYSYDFQNYSFICPHCQTYCSHNTLPIVSEIYRNERVRDLLDPRDNRHEVGFMNFAKLLPGSYLCICECQKCGRHSLMKNGQLEWPKPVGVPASKHMPDLVQQPYDEAQKVLDDSPWAACILLRIALERLCDHLGGTGSNLFKRIESLSLNASEQAIWDAIRKAGNAAAHENADRLFEYRDNMKPNIAITLSKLINQIVESHVASRIEAQEILKMLESN